MSEKIILVIDDEPVVLANIVEIFREEGFILFGASSGREGVELARQHLPDIIICDIMMPGMSGYEVLETLLQEPKTKTIPFIFLTAKVEKDDVRRGMELGADDYITKPFSMDSLIRAVRSRLQRFDAVKSGVIGGESSDGQPKQYGRDDTILVKVGTGSQALKVADIKFVSAENQYSCVKVKNGKKYIIRKSILAWERILPASLFLRLHRSQIINTDYIIEISRSSDHYLVYLSEEENPFTVSKRFAAKLKEQME